MKEYNTYIFDLDGTLLDTLEDLYLSTNHALKTYNLPERSLEEVRMFVGNGVRKLIERAVPGGESHPLFEQILAEFKTHYLVHGLEHTQPYAGVIEMLEMLRRNNKRIAVVSNKFYKATEELCQHFFGQYVEVAIGEREGIDKKPAPDTVIAAMKQLGVDGRDAVYVGDSDVDVQTAQNCHLPCISVLWGFRNRDFLECSGATDFIEKPQELYDWTIA